MTIHFKNLTFWTLTSDPVCKQSGVIRKQIGLGIFLIIGANTSLKTSLENILKYYTKSLKWFWCTTGGPNH